LGAVIKATSKTPARGIKTAHRNVRSEEKDVRNVLGKSAGPNWVLSVGVCGNLIKYTSNLEVRLSIRFICSLLHV
jgi:hypothetical protein